MFNKFVFSGGVVDVEDYDVVFVMFLFEQCCDWLLDDMWFEMLDKVVYVFVVVVICELWEEIGFILGGKGDWEKILVVDWIDYVVIGYVFFVQFM